MFAIMTGDVTCAHPIGELPGILAVGSQWYRHYTRVEVDQVILFAAVGVVAGIAGAKAMEGVQIFTAGPETRGRN